MDHNYNDPPRNNGPQKPDDKKKPNWLLAAIIAIAAVLLIGWIYNNVSASQYKQTTFSDFLDAKAADQLAEVQIRVDRIVYLTKEEAAKDPSLQKACYTGLPSGSDTMAMAKELHDMGVTVGSLPSTGWTPP